MVWHVRAICSCRSASATLDKEILVINGRFIDVVVLRS